MPVSGHRVWSRSARLIGGAPRLPARAVCACRSPALRAIFGVVAVWAAHRAEDGAPTGGTDLCSSPITASDIVNSVDPAFSVETDVSHPAGCWRRWAEP